MKKIAVIGGGASGLVAAIAAARSNPKVQITIYEQKDSVGKKILATGNGRCNLLITVVKIFHLLKKC